MWRGGSCDSSRNQVGVLLDARAPQSDTHLLSSKPPLSFMQFTTSSTEKPGGRKDMRRVALERAQDKDREGR
jgi:hypothetical protein